MARPGPSTRGQLHVGRYFAALGLIFAIIYATVAFAGPGSAWLKPKLGLDLQGGAQVILTPKTESGAKPSNSQLTAAVEILRQRVNGAGVSEAEVVIEGAQIVVSVPGGNRDSIATVTQAAQLQFRRVVTEEAAVPPVVPTPSATVKTSSGPSPAKSATPKPTASTAKRPVTSGLRAAAATPTPTPSATSTPSASSATGVPAGLVVSGSVYTAANYAALDCSNPKARAGGAPEVPTKEIVACDRTGTVKYHLAIAKVSGKDVKGANVGADPTTGQVQVNLQFKGSGQDRWTKLTTEAYNQTPPTNQVAIVLDGVVITAPTINSVINGDAQITGQFTQKEGQDLANNLKFGALPVSFVAGDAQVVSATLGSDQLRSGLLAGGIGLAAVVLYSLLYYRALGFVTIASLLISAGLTYGMICILGKELGFALSLAGIAGLIVSVGITADSFVVFFERLKDEIKEGRTPRSAVDRAWVRARRTILSADTVSLLAAVILYFVSVGGVRGFAFTLGLSTMLDVAVVFLFTRPLLSYLSRFRWFSRSRLTGFFGPDGGEPSLGGPRKSLVVPTPQEA
ncbi:MAG: protein-export rane protein SecD [Frankiales bacterium]|nr:protein-export rane protein SecD [Frankiales bacterium]